MTITMEQIKSLRTATGVGIGDCKSALEAANGDFEKAKVLLREKGNRISALTTATEGCIGKYFHHNHQIAVLVEVNCQTDFTARNSEFIEFADKLAMHICAVNPLYISRDDVPKQEVEQEKDFVKKQALELGRPENIIETKVIPGQLNKFYAEKCLLEQELAMDSKVKIADMLAQLKAKFGENIVIRRFTKYVVGS